MADKVKKHQTDQLYAIKKKDLISMEGRKTVIKLRMVIE